MRNRAGFTLVELMIVVGIVPLVALGLYALVHQFAAGTANLRTMMDTEEAGLRVRSAWRADVLAARTVELLPGEAGRQALAIHRDAPGGEIRVVYRLTAGGAIERAVEGPASRSQPEVLALGATRLAFERVGAGWRMFWTLEDRDGVRRWVWRQAAVATPLDPDREVQP
jgi:prepilin-type N-terminal cleavage/methylation domain-containing protein